jgi:hypothetical protein
MITIKKTTTNPPCTLRFALFLFLIFNFAFLIEATATIRYVSHTGSSTPPYTSWETAADSIQKCIDISEFGDTIYVAAGVYKERVIMINGLSLIGAGMDSSFIDTREFAQPSNFYSLVFLDSCLVKGFAINVSFENIGTGILINGSWEAINGIVESNKIYNSSIGIWAENCNVIIKNNVIINTNRGVRTGGFNPNYFPIVEQNYISASFHGVIVTVGTTPIIRNNVFYVNGQFARAYSGGGSDTARVYNNIAVIENGAGYWFPPVPTIGTNNIAFGNFNAGIWTQNVGQGTTIIKNNLTFGGNKGIEKTNSSIVQYNNSWNNQINYSGFTPDSTNLSVDPMVVSEDSADFHLQMFSPLIDAGDPDILDIDGSRSDIGAYGGPYGEKYFYFDLPPKSPRNFSYSLDTANTILSLFWDMNTEADFRNYKLYRDTVPDFDPTEFNLIGKPDTSLFYDNLSGITSSKIYYKATAVDSQDNESEPGEEIAVLITTLSSNEIITINDYRLFQNYPNPFNPSTKIGYRLKERGYVKMYVYDIKGELVSVLVNKEQEAGYYEVEFSLKSKDSPNGSLRENLNTNLASGIYLYQVMITNENNIPVFSDIKKMIYLK